MKFLLILSIFTLLLFSEEHKNELQFETSPYLKQHQTNPINWYPWGEKAFKKAKEENKAIFLSIGYSTCHWCHVMAQESFENEKIAEMFNKYFICIKVDREEMPHLDSYYQRLHVKLKNRTGGWPLSAFLSADKKPFYVATYIPPTRKPYHEGLDTLLPRIYKEYKNDYKSILKQINLIESRMNKPTKIVTNKNAKISVETLVKSISEEYDDIYSGFGRGKKFPEASKLSLMMDLATLKKDETLEKKTLEMLDAMALRGLYDHVDGGFFRYSVDAIWEIPHFEKMLYNQAELIPLYVRAYLKTNNELYKNVVIETIEMLDRRFLKDSLYYSASDADTHHKEGGYFLFTTAEIEDALKNNKYKEDIEESLEFSINGNFEGKVHLNFYTKKRPKGFDEFKRELLKVRKTKEYPFIDKKINTAWNSMMIEALYKASVIDKKYVEKADTHLNTLKEFMFDKGELYHQSLIGVKPKQKGLLEDYSFLISALISGYEVTYDEQKLDLAEYLLNQARYKFYKNSQWYLSADRLKIRADMRDKYYTSALAKMTQNLIRLAALKASFKYEKISLSTLELLNSTIELKQSDVPASATAFLMNHSGVITLKNSKERLLRDRVAIELISYPYLLSKKGEYREYLACTLRSCFAKDKELNQVKKDIEKYIYFLGF